MASIEPLKNIYRRALEMLVAAGMTLDRAGASAKRPPRTGGRFVWPRHDQRLRRSGLAGAVALGLPLDALDEHADSALAGAEEPTIEALSTRRIADAQAGRLPDREAWLQGVPFYVDERGIVPRSLHRRADRRRHARRLAWRTTRAACSTCAPATAASRCWPRWPGPSVDGRRGRHLRRCAGGGAHQRRRHELGERITLLHGDLLAAWTAPYDLILCNPPYVNAASMAALPPEYRAEPALALAGGADGMDFVRRCCARRRRT